MNDELLFKRNIYASIRAIETKSLADDQEWLTYWILYSMITLFEITFDMLMGGFDGVRGGPPHKARFQGACDLKKIRYVYVIFFK
ncbi:hypothetical protein HanPI659440_Chr03g0095531 [Helianthus annuus]|nr:hypothetical protein HanPI659440_Chr03g0095531 [Helianthus annuus]